MEEMREEGKEEEHNFKKKKKPLSAVSGSSQGNY